MTTNAAMAPAEPLKRAYVTLLVGADDGERLNAVTQLAEDLRKVGAAYPLVVAVLPDLPESHRDVLVSQGCIVREIAPVHLPPENPAQCAMASGFFLYYSVLRIWEFVEYERVVYLDAGIHVPENIDELFELEKGHFYTIELVSSPPAPYFNAGIMFVHEPSATTAQALLDALHVTTPQPFPEDEHDFMNMFFRDLYKPIPLDHRLVRAMLLGHTAEDEQLDEAKRRPLGETVLAPGSWFATNAKVLYRQDLPAIAALVASLATMGMITHAANPAICFCFYTVFIAAVAAVNFSLGRND